MKKKGSSKWTKDKTADGGTIYRPHYPADFGHTARRTWKQTGQADSDRPMTEAESRRFMGTAIAVCRKCKVRKPHFWVSVKGWHCKTCKSRHRSVFIGRK